MFLGGISAGDLSAFIFYAIVVATSVGAISEVVGDLQRAAGAVERLFELLDMQPNIAAPADPRSLPEILVARVSMDNVTFRYPSRPEHPALMDFTLDVAPGETVALVGPSGAGKTSVFQLLLRFYDPDTGRLRWTGSICGSWIRQTCVPISVWCLRSPWCFRECLGKHPIWPPGCLGCRSARCCRSGFGGWISGCAARRARYFSG